MVRHLIRGDGVHVCGILSRPLHARRATFGSLALSEPKKYTGKRAFGGTTTSAYNTAGRVSPGTIPLPELKNENDAQANVHGMRATRISQFEAPTKT